MVMKECRKRIWIDSFQTSLLIRIALYCVVFQIAAWSFSALCEAIDACMATMGVRWLLFSNGPVRSILALLVMVPPLTLDAVRFAHRLVGPLYRFRKAIQAMAAGEPVSLIQLRQGDFLMDLKDDFNAMLRQLEQKGLVLVKAPETSQAIPTPQPAGCTAPTTAGLDS